jgi:hypothetical protein
MKKLSISDRKFLAACKISMTVEPFDDAKFLAACGVRVDEPSFAEQRLELARRIARHQAPIQLDGTCRLLLALGLPLTRENYLQLAFAGHPPEEPLDGEIEAELPEQFRTDEED